MAFERHEVECSETSTGYTPPVYSYMKLHTMLFSTRGKYYVSNFFIFGILLRTTDRIENYTKGRVGIRSEKFFLRNDCFHVC